MYIQNQSLQKVGKGASVSGNRDARPSRRTKRKGEIIMKAKNKILTALICVLGIIGTVTLSTAALKHTVTKGESMWKIAVKYEVGLDELRAANPNIKNASLIYPGDVLEIPSVNSQTVEFEKEVIRLVNKERKERGLSELKYNWQLSRVARFKSEDMSAKGYFSHQSPTYGSPFEMMKNFGISYRTAGENIAKGYTSPAAVVNGWMNSSGHRANILNSSFKEIGVGYCAEGRYWTQMFIA